MKYILLIGVVALLAGCNPRDTPAVPFVKYEVEADGCLVKYVDNPRGYNFFIAKCPSSSEVITHQRASGKTTTTEVTVVTSDNLRKQLAEVEAKEKALSKLTDEEKKLLGVK